MFAILKFWYIYFFFSDSVQNHHMDITNLACDLNTWSSRRANVRINYLLRPYSKLAGIKKLKKSPTATPMYDGFCLIPDRCFFLLFSRFLFTRRNIVRAVCPPLSFFGLRTYTLLNHRNTYPTAFSVEEFLFAERVACFGEYLSVNYVKKVYVVQKIQKSECTQ